jgi:nucleoside-diphosphate-sugar epimerase
MIAKSILVYGGMNFIAARLIEKLCEFSHYRIAVADNHENNNLDCVKGKILFEKTIDKLDIINKYQFDIVIDFVNLSLVNMYLRQFDKPDIIVNISECYGPKQNEKDFIPKLILTVFQEDYLYVNINNERNLIYVDDVCNAIMKIFHFGNIHSVYSIFTNQKYKDLDIARLILRKMQLPMTLIEHIESNNITFRSLENDDTNIRKLGWMPKTSIDVGLDLTMKWFRREYD